MALEPCKVCGTLNSSESEICLSCGYPTAGRKRPLIFQWTAFILIFALTLPLSIGLINWFKLKLMPQQTSPKKQQISLLARS